MFAHPAFAPYREWLVAGTLPDIALLNRWAREVALRSPDCAPPRFVEMPSGGALAYEHAVARDGVVRMRRDNLHDAMNALVWIAFPRTKAALNARHVHDGASPTANARSRARDAATLLDESGLVLVCADEALADLLRGHAWHRLFVEHAAAVTGSLRPLVIGHGLLAKLTAPYRAITARTLIVACDPTRLPTDAAGVAQVDAIAAASIADRALVPERLPPLPVAALPGWDSERLGARLFDDVTVFRPVRT